MESVTIAASGKEAHLDTVLARGSDDLAGIELQGGYGMVILECLKDPARAHVPNLFTGSVEGSQKAHHSIP